MSLQICTRIPEFLDSLFQEEFGDQTEHDPEVLRLVEEHLGRGAFHPKAGFQLAEALLQLAKARAEEDQWVG